MHYADQRSLPNSSSTGNTRPSAAHLGLLIRTPRNLSAFLVELAGWTNGGGGNRKVEYIFFMHNFEFNTTSTLVQSRSRI